MIDDLMEFGDIEPPDVPSKEVCRKVRVEAVDEALNLKGPKNVIKSFMYQMQDSSLIKEFAPDDLNVIYWFDN